MQACESRSDIEAGTHFKMIRRCAARQELTLPARQVGERNSLLTLDVGLPNGVLGGWPARKLQNEQIAGSTVFLFPSFPLDKHTQENLIL